MRGLKAVKTADVPIRPKGAKQDIVLKIAVVHGTEKIVPLLQEVREGKSPYHFIEVMNCPQRDRKSVV